MDGRSSVPLNHFLAPFINFKKMYFDRLNEKGTMTSLGEDKHTVHDN